MTRIEQLVKDLPADPEARGHYALALGFEPIEAGSGYTSRHPIPGNKHDSEVLPTRVAAARAQVEWFIRYWIGL